MVTEQMQLDLIDAHIGARIRLRRTLLGMSQERLGESLGLTFQQVQKYERGANRVSASRLHDLARVLDVPIPFFYEELPGDAGPARSSPSPGPGFADAQTSLAPPASPMSGTQSGAEEHMHRRETLELIRAYYRIIEPSVRKRVFELIKSMGPQD